MSDGRQKTSALPSTSTSQSSKIEDKVTGNGTAKNAAESADQASSKPKKALKLSKKTDAYVPDEIDVAKVQQLSSKSTSQQQSEPKLQKPNLLETLQPQRTPVQATVQAFVPPQLMFPMHAPMMHFGFPPMMPVPQMPQVRHDNYGKSGQSTSEELPDMATMMQELANAQYLNINPVVYNQVLPGQEAPYSMGMNSDLKDYVSNFQDMTEDEQLAVFQEAIETGLIGNNDSFNGSHGHTYSDIDPNAEVDYYGDDDAQEDPEDPTTWECTPEERKRREEERKKIFSPDFKDCSCCHGYVFACSSDICKTLGVCHCVAHKQNEYTSAANQEVQVIPESANCTCCKGHALNCSCVTQNKKASCHCVQ